jgi:hypothetical protein
MASIGVVGYIPQKASIMDLQGVVEWDGPALTVEQLDDAIGEHLADEDQRSRRTRLPG